MIKLSPAQLRALDKFAQAGGHGFGEYAYLSRSTAMALWRLGLILVGTAGTSDRRHTHGVISEKGLSVLNEAERARGGYVRKAENTSLAHLPYGFSVWSVWSDALRPRRRTQPVAPPGPGSPGGSAGRAAPASAGRVDESNWTTRLEAGVSGGGLTPRLATLLADARAAGYEILPRGGELHVVRRHRGHGGVIRGITIYADGTAFIANMDLSAAAGMRSYADMRDVLRLPREAR